MRLGLVGYGVGGRYFHAPYIDAVDNIELVGVVTRSPQRKHDVEHDYPGLPTFDSLAALLSHGADAVTITTPPQTRRDLVLEAIDAKVAIVADKPFAPDARSAQTLANAALSAGVLLTVFHNRRWDADIQTLKAVLASGEIGAPTYFESRMDQNSPHTLEAGPHGGLLRDLGSHIVDQALWLFGAAQEVSASTLTVNCSEGRTDSAFRIEIVHGSGMRSRLSSTKLGHIDDRELRVYGTRATYVSCATDVQFSMVTRGLRPKDLGADWGYEPESSWGRLFGPEGMTVVAPRPGRYQDFYEQFEIALRGHGPLPVDPQDAVRTLALLDAARISAHTGRTVRVA